MDQQNEKPKKLSQKLQLKKQQKIAYPIDKLTEVKKPGALLNISPNVK